MVLWTRAESSGFPVLPPFGSGVGEGLGVGGPGVWGVGGIGAAGVGTGGAADEVGSDLGQAQVAGLGDAAQCVERFGGGAVPMMIPMAWSMTPRVLSARRSRLVRLI